MLVFELKRGDTSPALMAALQDDAGAAVDITGASVRFHMKAIGGAVKVDAAAVIVDPVAGEVQYSWAPEDTDTAGRFSAEIEVTYTDATVETFPNGENILIVIRDDLA